MSAAIKMTLGTFYLIGASLLIPGFVWIQPLDPLCVAVIPGVPKPIPVCCDLPIIIQTVANIPHFKDGQCGSQNVYGQGVWCIVVGTLLFIFASVIDFVSAVSTPQHVHNPEESGHKTDDAAHGGSFAEAGQSLAETGAAGGAGSCLKRMLGPTLMVIGSCLIFAGAILFLPRFSLPVDDQGHGTAPKEILGQPAPNVAITLFQVAAVVFLISAVTAILGVATGIIASRKAGRPTCVLWFSLVAFVCFIPCSTLYFANSFVEDDVEAGHWRMAGTVFLASACYILFAVTLYEVCQGPPAKDASNSASGDPLNTM